jgi:hypothetical protein
MTALSRVARRIVRKVLKPLRLRWVAFKAQRSDEYYAALVDLNDRIQKLMRKECKHRIELSAERMAIEREVA